MQLLQASAALRRACDALGLAELLVGDANSHREAKP